MKSKIRQLTILQAQKQLFRAIFLVLSLACVAFAVIIMQRTFTSKSANAISNTVFLDTFDRRIYNTCVTAGPTDDETCNGASYPMLNYVAFDFLSGTAPTTYNNVVIDGTTIPGNKILRFSSTDKDRPSGKYALRHTTSCRSTKLSIDILPNSHPQNFISLFSRALDFGVNYMVVYVPDLQWLILRKNMPGQTPSWVDLAIKISFGAYNPASTYRLSLTTTGYYPTELVATLEEVGTANIVNLVAQDNEPILQQPGEFAMRFTPRNFGSIVNVPSFANPHVSYLDNVKISCENSNNAPTKTSIGIVGDSISHTNGATIAMMRQLGANYTFVNAALYSTTVNDWIQDSFAGSSQVDVRPYSDAMTKFNAAGVKTISLMLGTNDAAQGVSVADFEANLRQLTAKLLNDGMEKIILHCPIYNLSNTISQKVVEYCNVMRTVANSQTIFLGDDQAYAWFEQNTTTAFADATHPNAYGQKNLGEFWGKAYQRLFFAEPKLLSVSPNTGLVTGGELITLKTNNIGFNNLRWKQVSSRHSHACGIAYDNWLYCWGLNNYGQLGTGEWSSVPSTMPKAIVRGAIPANATILQVATGQASTCVLASDYKVYCWGYNFDGELGNGTKGAGNASYIIGQFNPGIDTNVPVAVSNLTNIVQIATSHMHVCALDNFGKVYCWGNNGYGQIGNNVYGGYGYGGGADTVSVPTEVTRRSGPNYLQNDVKVVQIATSKTHTCAVGNNGEIYCWGRGVSGELGLGLNNASYSLPIKVARGAIPADAVALQVSIGSSFSCARVRHSNGDQRVYCWGDNYNGVFGNGAVLNQGDIESYDAGVDSNTPVLTVNTTGNSLVNKTITYIAASENFVCAVDDSGNVHCWGNNTNGQLGDNGTTSRSVSAPIFGFDGNQAVLTNQVIEGLSAGVKGNFVLASDGKIYVWGGSPVVIASDTMPIVPVPTQSAIPKYRVNFGGSNIAQANFLNLVNDTISLIVPPAAQANSTAPAPHHGSVPVSITNLILNRTSNELTYSYISAPQAPDNLAANTALATTEPAKFNISLSWSAPGSTEADPTSQLPNQGNGNSPIIDYIIEYCEASSGGVCSGSWAVYGDGVNVDTNATLSNLPASSTGYYSLRVSAKNLVGISPYSSTVVANTTYVVLTLANSTDIDNIVPGVTKEAPIDVTVKSNTNYKLYLKDFDTDLRLNKGTDSIASSTNLYTAPAVLGNNTWGYRLAGNPVFGTDKYAGITALDQQIASGSGSISGVTSRVFFGVKVDSQKSSGHYTDIVTFTAVAD